MPRLFWGAHPGGHRRIPGVARKPAPDTVFRALEELGAGTGRAVYVGDSDVDIQTAANAGLPCLSVSWGFRDAEFLTAHGAQRIVDTPRHWRPCSSAHKAKSTRHSKAMAGALIHQVLLGLRVKEVDQLGAEGKVDLRAVGDTGPVLGGQVGGGDARAPRRGPRR
ncbi:MAG: HAD family hydrolase [Flavonifractor plautii]